MRKTRTSGSMSGVEETDLWRASASGQAKATPRSRLRPSYGHRASRRLYTPLRALRASGHSSVCLAGIDSMLGSGPSAMR